MLDKVIEIVREAGCLMLNREMFTGAFITINVSPVYMP